jgi:hypothetical protein
MLTTFGANDIELISSFDEENNIVRFRIKNWIRILYDIPTIIKSMNIILIDDCMQNIPDREFCSTVLNTTETIVTVSAKGAVIIRLAWPNTIQCYETLESRLLQSSDILACVLTHMC